MHPLKNQTFPRRTAIFPISLDVFGAVAYVREGVRHKAAPLPIMYKAHTHLEELRVQCDRQRRRTEEHDVWLRLSSRIKTERRCRFNSPAWGPQIFRASHLSYPENSSDNTYFTMRRRMSSSRIVQGRRLTKIPDLGLGRSAMAREPLIAPGPCLPDSDESHDAGSSPAGLNSWTGGEQGSVAVRGRGCDRTADFVRIARGKGRGEPASFLHHFLHSERLLVVSP